MLILGREIGWGNCISATSWYDLDFTFGHAMVTPLGKVVVRCRMLILGREIGWGNCISATSWYDLDFTFGHAMVTPLGGDPDIG